MNYKQQKLLAKAKESKVIQHKNKYGEPCSLANSYSLGSFLNRSMLEEGYKLPNNEFLYFKRNNHLYDIYINHLLLVKDIFFVVDLEEALNKLGIQVDLYTKRDDKKWVKATMDKVQWRDQFLNMWSMSNPNMWETSDGRYYIGEQPFIESPRRPIDGEPTIRESRQ